MNNHTLRGSTSVWRSYLARSSLPPGYREKKKKKQRERERERERKRERNDDVKRAGGANPSRRIVRRKYPPPPPPPDASSSSSSSAPSPIVHVRPDAITDGPIKGGGRREAVARARKIRVQVANAVRACHWSRTSSASVTNANAASAAIGRTSASLPDGLTDDRWFLNSAPRPLKPAN